MVVTSKNTLIARRLLETMLTEANQELITELLKTATYFAEQKNEPFNFVGETFEVSIDLRAGVIVKGVCTFQKKPFEELLNDDG